MLYLFIIGLVAGILSTASMTITEIPSWKRWGIYGVFEWHENYIITKRLRLFLHFSNTSNVGVESHFKGIFFFHFLNGVSCRNSIPVHYFIYNIIIFFSYYSILLFIWYIVRDSLMDCYSCTRT